MKHEETRKYWRDKQVSYLMDTYGFNEQVAETVFDRHWEKHHAYISDLENCIDDEAEYAVSIIHSYLAD